MNGQANIR